MQKDFLENFESLVKLFSELGNPFLEESGDLYKLDTKEVADPESADIENLLSIGLKQYESFLERLTNKGQPALNFYDVIKKNNFSLFSRKQKPGPSSADAKLKNLKGDCNLFSRLFISCQSRQCNMEVFFSHENQAGPPYLSQNGGLNIGIKSQLMDILESFCDVPSATSPSDALIIDGSAMVNSRPPRGPQTFSAYANDVILSYIESCTCCTGKF